MSVTNNIVMTPPYQGDIDFLLTLAQLSAFLLKERDFSLYFPLEPPTLLKFPSSAKASVLQLCHLIARYELRAYSGMHFIQMACDHIFSCSNHEDLPETLLSKELNTIFSLLSKCVSRVSETTELSDSSVKVAEELVEAIRKTDQRPDLSVLTSRLVQLLMDNRNGWEALASKLMELVALKNEESKTLQLNKVVEGVKDILYLSLCYQKLSKQFLIAIINHITTMLASDNLQCITNEHLIIQEKVNRAKQFLAEYSV
jgi:hypothetical protein